MLPILKERFEGNIKRVGTLVGLYAWIGAIKGQPNIEDSDLLRAAVVLLHAALEDLLREIAAWRLPHADQDTLSRIPCAGGDGRKTTLTLGGLAQHRDKMVNEFITESVAIHLDRTSYNGVDDIARLFAQIGLSSETIKRLIKPYAGNLESMMSRRHQIVHRLDRFDRGKSSRRGNHGVLSIGINLVASWTDAVVGFSDDTFEELEQLL